MAERNLMKEIAEKEGLKEKLLELQRNSENAGDAKDQYVEKAVALLKENGIEVSKDELLAIVDESSNAELSPDDLDNVAGGCGNNCGSYSKNCPAGWEDC